MNSRETILQRILAERERQFNLPGREYDSQNTPNDWVGIACSYASDGVARNHAKLDVAAYDDALIKAAAVIVAALEHMDMMTEKAQFRENTLSN